MKNDRQPFVKVFLWDSFSTCNVMSLTLLHFSSADKEGEEEEAKEKKR
jgi:hypothetical protein